MREIIELPISFGGKCSKDTNTCFMVSVWYILKLLLTSVSVKEVDIYFPFSNIIIVNDD